MRFGAIYGVLMAGALASVAMVMIPERTQSQTADPKLKSVAAFAIVASVLASPRCQNCHTLTDFPRQGEDGHPHLFHVMRGPADHGETGLPCSTCHGTYNNTASGVPGADEDWHLAPVNMGWEGLSTAELCRHLKDPQHNGGRNGDQIVDHLASHLVKWAWSAGTNRRGVARAAPPVSYPEFVQAAETWARTGAACP